MAVRKPLTFAQPLMGLGALRGEGEKKWEM